MWTRERLMVKAGDGEAGGTGAGGTGDQGAGAGSGAGTGAGGAGSGAGTGAAGTGTGGAPAAGTAAAAAKLDAQVGLWPEDWRTQLAGDDAKAQKRLERFASPGDIYRSYRALEQRLSTGELRSTLPKDATPEQKAAWRTENGIPAAADKYDLTLGDGLVIGETDKPMVDAFTKAAHEADMHPNQVKRVLKWYYDFAEQQAATQATKDAQAMDTGTEALRADWGVEYKPNLARISSLLDLAPAGVKDQMMGGRLADGTPFMSDPKTLQWLVGLARELNPASTVVPHAGANAAGTIDDEIKDIEKYMREHRKEYNRDEKKQQRLRDLYDAREKVKARSQQAA